MRRYVLVSQWYDRDFPELDFEIKRFWFKRNALRELTRSEAERAERAKTSEASRNFTFVIREM